MTGGGAVPLIWGRLEPPASRATASPGDAGAGSRRDPQAAPRATARVLRDPAYRAWGGRLRYFL